MSAGYLRSTVHCHTNCCDGRATAAEMARVAWEAGVKTLGFSGHGYAPFDPPYSMSEQGTRRYFSELAALREEYAGRMDILCGVEWDLYSQPVPQLAGSAPQALCGEGEVSRFGYVIGSSHYIRGAGRYYPVDGSRQDVEDCVRAEFGGDGEAFAEAYFSNVATVAKTVRPEILGHFDLVKKQNRDGHFFDENGPRYLAAANAALRAARAAGCALELNTGGVYRGYREDLYPGPALLRLWWELGGDVVITADAHEPQALLFGFDAAAAAARAVGYKRVLVITRNGFEECRLG